MLKKLMILCIAVVFLDTGAASAYAMADTEAETNYETQVETDMEGEERCRRRQCPPGEDHAPDDGAKRNGHDGHKSRNHTRRPCPDGPTEEDWHGQTRDPEDGQTEAPEEEQTGISEEQQIDMTEDEQTAAPGDEQMNAGEDGQSNTLEEEQVDECEDEQICVPEEEQTGVSENEQAGKSGDLGEGTTAGDHTAVETVNTTANHKVYNWYCMHRNDGVQPKCDPEMSFIEDYQGYYVDMAHSAADDKDKVIYLTFDAGYENGNIAKILDVLQNEQVPGAFFILENLIVRDTDVVRRMVDEGHTVCNHTASHRDMTKITDMAVFKEELEELESTYQEYTGAQMAKFYRPPEGKFNLANMKMASELGYSTIFWSFAYADWDNNSQMNPDRAREKVLNGTHNGEILLLHPTSSTNAEILGDLIVAWRDMGYRFGKLEELISSADQM